MRTTYYQPRSTERPKRGDILQSAIGTKRERTWLVLHAHPLPHGAHPVTGESSRRTKLWAARWWELDAEFRMALYRSAERAGGQNLYPLYRFPVKKKARSFEEYMRSAA